MRLYKGTPERLRGDHLEGQDVSFNARRFGVILLTAKDGQLNFDGKAEAPKIGDVLKDTKPKQEYTPGEELAVDVDPRGKYNEPDRMQYLFLFQNRSSLRTTIDAHMGSALLFEQDPSEDETDRPEPQTYNEQTGSESMSPLPVDPDTGEQIDPENDRVDGEPARRRGAKKAQPKRSARATKAGEPVVLAILSKADLFKMVSGEGLLLEGPA